MTNSVMSCVRRSLAALKRSSCGTTMEHSVSEEVDAQTAMLDAFEQECATRERVSKQIQSLSDTACSTINAMSSKEVAYSNANFDFQREPRLYQRAIKCIDKIEAQSTDSRDLGIAFGNSFTNIYRFDEDIFANGCYLIDVPHDQIIVAMDWMTELAIKHSPFWVKWTCDIPVGSLSSRESFERFVEEFANTEHESEESLLASGKE